MTKDVRSSSEKVIRAETGQGRVAVADVRTVVLLAVPPIHELDLVGPLAVFAGANRILGDLGPAYRIKVLSAKRKRIIVGECGISLFSHGHYTNLREPIDTLIIVGSFSSRTTRNPELSLWLKNRSTRTRRIASVCVGAFQLAEAGLLEGKRATTHWFVADELRRKYPAVKVDLSPIWVRDGKTYTSAGVTAGIDLALAMVEDDCGSTVALGVARGLVVFLRRPGNQAQFSVSLAGQASEREVLRDLQAWIAEHLSNDLRVEQLADRVAMSPRNFSRVFSKEIGTPPAKFVAHLRVEAARRQLEESDRNLKQVASSCGFSSVEIMRRCFLAELQVTPGAYRKRFRIKSGRRR
jgi:transcriptional regulator GlxA family with amidase domain